MSKFKNRTSRLAALAIKVLLALALSLIFTASNGILAFEAETDTFVNGESKVFSKVSIDDDFDDSSVLVVMDRHIGGINKLHSESFFGDFAKEAVYDLTYMDNVVKNRANIDETNFRQILQIKLPEKSKENVINVIRQLEKIEGIISAGPNYYDTPAAQPTNAGGTRYPNLWGMHGIRGIQAENAWNITTGNANVRVGVIDSGLDAHPDLNANILAEGGDFVNMANLEQNIPGALRADGNGHGTHVAGTIAAAGTNANGVAGVVWNVSLIPLQVANAANRWPLDAVTRAITWAIDNDIDIINYSGGGTVDDETRRTAIGNFQGLFICGAGNNDRSNENNTGTNRLFYPSDYSHNQTFSDRVISVGAIMESGNRPTFANWGFSDPPTNTQPNGSNFGATAVSVFAPGDGILSTQSIARGNLYEYLSGTSMATPMVSGAAALMWSVYENANSTLTREQRAAAIKTAIINNVDRDTIGGVNPLQGLCVANGRLNIFKAVSTIAFTSSSVSGGISINGFINGYTMPNNTELVLPDSFAPLGDEEQQPVVAIGDGAFANQTQLSKISIPASTTSIGPNAFENCTNLTSVTLPDNLISIGSEAFKGCTNLNNLIIPSSVVSISSNAFDNCTSLNNIVREFKYNINVANCYYFIKENLNNELIKVDGNTIVATSVIVPLYFNIGEHIIEIKTDNISSAIDTPIFEATSQLLLNSNQDIRSSIQNKKNVFYFNNHATRFVTFTLEASSSGTINYSANSIVVRDLNGVIQKFTIDGISNEAKNVNGSNTVTVYLPDIKKYYVEVNFDVTAEISELKLTARLLDNPSQVNLFDLDEDVKSSIDLFNNTTSKGDEIKAINILQSGKFEFKTDSTDQTANPIFVIMKKEVVNNQTVIEFFDAWEMDDYTKEVYLESGIYYVGYFNIVVGTNITIQIFRLVNQSGSHVLVTDPDVWTPSGSQISIIEADKSIKSYRQTFITEGFTRLIYPDFNYGVSASRLDYDWYSSNTNVATVTPYGTVLALPVTTDTTVKIMAVLKVNPSKVFVKEFTVLNDTETYSSAPIDIFVETTISASQHIYASSFFAGITVPIVILQYYSWSSSNTSYASVDGWGIIYAYQSAVGETVVITGNYLYNSRVKITMLFLITY